MNEHQVFFFREGEPVKVSSNDILTGYKDYYAKDKDGKIRFLVCGFLVVDDCPVIIFPKNFPMNIDNAEEDDKENAKILFKTFARYISRKSRSRGWLERHTSESMDEFDGNTRINDILYILDDFKRNGYLVRRHNVISQTRPGRVMWNKTMQKVTPIISHRQVLYPSPYMKSRVRHDEEMIQKIHRYLVDTFCYQWGWLVDMEGKTAEPQAPCTDEEAKKYIAAELRACFVQREIDLLRRMLRYYRKKIGENTKPRAEYMLTKEFEYIWEDVCSTVFGNVREKNSNIIPKAEFKPSEGYKERSWQQRPDILCKKGNKYYVLDAKYYPLKADETSEVVDGEIMKIHNFPGWADIVKQFVYFYSIKKRLENQKKNETVERNLLLFPSYVTELVGRAVMLEVEEFGEIELWWLNIKDMLNEYVSGNQKDVEKCFKLNHVNHEINRRALFNFFNSLQFIY